LPKKEAFIRVWFSALLNFFYLILFDLSYGDYITLFLSGIASTDHMGVINPCFFFFIIALICFIPLYRRPFSV